jgi:E3 ubiquitin-protein ligase NEDD4
MVGHVEINVRRNHLLEDSMRSLMDLRRNDFRKIWKFHFIGERGMDAGGLAREWFELVTKKMFDPSVGLWQTSAANQMCMQINAASGEYEKIEVAKQYLRKAAYYHENM